MSKKIIALLLTLIVTAFSVPSAFAVEEADHAIHEELRGLLQGMEKAVNEERYDDLAPFFHKDIRVTTINQEIISSRDEIAIYFNRWFGPEGYLKKVEMKLSADALTELYANKTFGIVRGTGIENYILSDSRYYEMETRWTATVIKDTDGKWRILSLHIGTNFLDNPILSEIEDSLIYFGIGGIVLGFILMLIFSFVRKVMKRA